MLRECVLRLKTAGNQTLAYALGRTLGSKLKQMGFAEACSALAPVPIHWVRRMTRGVSVAELLAAGVADELGLAHFDDLFKNQRQTQKQGTLSRTERISNVRNAFMLRSGFEIDGCRLLLIDDVMTTGATLNELARLALKSGAAEVRVAVLARGLGVS
jgi:ComF family protein